MYTSIYSVNPPRSFFRGVSVFAVGSVVLCFRLCTWNVGEGWVTADVYSSNIGSIRAVVCRNWNGN